jgi:hypothetical protein
MKRLKEWTLQEKVALLEKCKMIYKQFSSAEKYLIGYQDKNGCIYGVMIDFNDFWKTTLLDECSGTHNIIIRCNGIKKISEFKKFLICDSETWQKAAGKSAGAKFETLFNKKPDNKNFSESPDVVLKDGTKVQLKFFGRSAANCCSVALLEKLSGKTLIEP